MIVDASYMAWVRPTRRVRLALSVGMTVTGVILIAAGLPGGREAARPAPPLGRTADTVVSGGGGAPADGVAGPVPPAPLVHFAPPTATAKPHPRPGPHIRHATPSPSPAPHHTPHPSDLPHLLPVHPPER